MHDQSSTFIYAAERQADYHRISLLCSLDIKTVINTWEWERYRFMIDCAHRQVRLISEFRFAFVHPS